VAEYGEACKQWERENIVSRVYARFKEAGNTASAKLEPALVGHDVSLSYASR
jgi:hypothetical protein